MSVTGTTPSPELYASGGIVVVGGGIAGVTAAIEAAEAGHEVLLLEQEPCLGGRVARMHHYFPKLCPPTCGMEINFKRIKNERRVRVLTGARVKAIAGAPGGYQLEVELAARMVNERCTCCGKCVPACPVERSDSYNYGIGMTKAIYLPHLDAFPMRFAIDPQSCLGESCAKCVAYCPYDAIDLRERTRTVTLGASAVVVATGWQPYDARRLENLGFGRFEDVVTNLMLERMASQSAPGGGKLVRPSDQGPLRRVAFVQCAGSRDQNHLPYCSTVCCTASLKQAHYIRQQYPDAEVHIFYIDIRTMGVLEDFATRVRKDEKIFLHRGKVAKVEAEGKGLRVIAEDTLSGERHELVVDLCVLAVGIQAQTQLEVRPDANGELPLRYDAQGFVAPGRRGGVVGAGCARRPYEASAAVQDATGAALRAIQALRARHPAPIVLPPPKSTDAPAEGR
jgi:quinone-modifying oxidoreductase subunit QmoA